MGSSPVRVTRSAPASECRSALFCLCKIVNLAIFADLCYNKKEFAEKGRSDPVKRFFLRAAAAVTGLMLSVLSTDCFSVCRSFSELSADAASFMVQGIDVSKFQESIDWNMVAKSGERFAIIRCCKVVHETGQKEYDYNFDINYAGAKDAGLAVGCYMYTDAATEEEFRADTEFLLGHLDGKSFDLPVFFDLESKTRQEHLPSASFMPPLLSALAQIEAEGHTAGVYANTAFFSECLD